MRSSNSKDYIFLEFKKYLKSNHFYYLLAICIVMAALLVHSSAAFFSNVQKEVEDYLYIQESAGDVRTKIYYDTYSQMFSILSSSYKFQSYLRNKEPGCKQALEDDWIKFMESSKALHHIRFIDLNGKEKIRVDYNTKTMKATAIKGSDKYHRKYFQSMKQRSKKFGTYGLDLDHKSKEEDLTSVRIATAIQYDNKNVGFLVFNVLLAPVRNNIMRGYEETAILVSQFGEVVSTPKVLSSFIGVNKNKGFMGLNDSPIGLVIINSVWEKISRRSEGFLEYDGYVIRFTKNTSFGQYFDGYLVTYMAPDKRSAMESEKIKTFYKYSVLMVFVLIILIVLFAIGKFYIETKFEPFAPNSFLTNAFMALTINENLRIINCSEKLFNDIHSFDIQKDYLYQIIKGIDKEELSVNLRSMTKSSLSGYYFNKDSEKTYVLINIEPLNEKKGIYGVSLVDITDLKIMEKKLRYLSERDYLTGLYNRRCFDFILNRRCLEENNYGSMAIIDIDHFKKINDNYGHDVGDLVIKEVATKILDVFPSDSFISARVGGEEFAVISRLEPIEMSGLVEKLSDIIEYTVSAETPLESAVTISGGVTYICDSASSVYKTADQALYRAKATGRNKVVLNEKSVE